MVHFRADVTGVDIRFTLTAIITTPLGPVQARRLDIGCSIGFTIASMPCSSGCLAAHTGPTSRWS
jgi:hypothetical protein